MYMQLITKHTFPTSMRDDEYVLFDRIAFSFSRGVCSTSPFSIDPGDHQVDITIPYGKGRTFYLTIWNVRFWDAQDETDDDQ